MSKRVGRYRGRKPFATDEALGFLATKYATSEPMIVTLVERELSKRRANRKKLSREWGREVRAYRG